MCSQGCLNVIQAIEEDEDPKPFQWQLAEIQNEFTTIPMLAGSVRLPAQLGSRLRSGSGSAQLSSARLGSARQLRRTGAKEKKKNRQQKKTAEQKKPHIKF